jgi:hypothetical protein
MVFDRYVLAIDVAGFAEALIESGHQKCVGIARPAAHNPDDGYRRLLPTRRERPSGCRANKTFDEIASSHCLPHAWVLRRLWARLQQGFATGEMGSDRHFA